MIQNPLSSKLGKMNIAEMTAEITQGKGYVVLSDLLSLKEATEATELAAQRAPKTRETAHS